MINKKYYDSKTNLFSWFFFVVSQKMVFFFPQKKNIKKRIHDEILLDKEINRKYKLKIIKVFTEIFIQWYSEDDLKNIELITNSLLFSLIPLHNNDKCI
jgi:hypothetical protein